MHYLHSCIYSFNKYLLGICQVQDRVLGGLGCKTIHQMWTSNIQIKKFKNQTHLLSVHGTSTQTIDFFFIFFNLLFVVFLFLHLTPLCYVDTASKGEILGNFFSRTMPKENG